MSARRSLGLMAATRLVVVALSFATVVIVSRLLTPEEIGIFSVSVALLGIAHVFRDFGVSNFLMQTPEVTPQRKRAAFTVTLAFSSTIALLLVAIAPFAATFYGDPRVGNVMWLLALNFMILPFGAPLRTLLQRNLQFRKVAVVALGNHITQSFVTVGAAWAGASYMSMALGSVAGNVANVVILLIVSPTGALDWPTRHGLREVLSFGSQSSTASLAGAVGGAAPDLVLGRTLGFAEVAFYSRAKGLVGMALDHLMHVVNTVFLPTFAKGARDGRDPAVLYAQTVGLLLGVTVPVIALLAVLSPTLVVALFGAAWARSGPLGSLFCAFALLTAPFVLAGSALIATGHVGALMRARLLIEGARIGVLLGSIWLGLEAVVALLGLVYALQATLYMWALRRRVGLAVGTLWVAAWRSYALALATVALPWLLVVADGRFGLLPDWWLLASATATALAAWMAGLFALRHPLRHEAMLAARTVGHRLRHGARRDP